MERERGFKSTWVLTGAGSSRTPLATVAGRMERRGQGRPGEGRRTERPPSPMDAVAREIWSPPPLFKDGVLQTKIRDKDDPRLSKMRKEVVAGGKDAMEVDNDFFLVPVKISDHQLQTSSQNKKKDKAAVFRSCPFHFYNAKNTAEIFRAHDEHQCKKFNSYGK
ncbi:hypothetical protein OsI_28230 [Oryza sativa Indica Group]|uniref:Uncharacterized protein n=1 Tax=Oryza sativa subsp. indica TaxID=39946 RepID=B8BBW5_ORYSI|nr:hypothetical protein OsI_28230 [Oryza sativa Indica Group]